MIPTFPTMHPITLEIRPALQAHLSLYPPYSDFGHTALWAWDKSGHSGVAMLHGNLVVLFHTTATATATATERFFYSFLGHECVDAVADVLLESSAQAGYPVELRLVPEEVALLLNPARFEIIEDSDHHDYVLTCEDLTTYSGSRYRRQRKWVNQFNRVNGCEISTLNLESNTTHKHITVLSDVWRDNRCAAERPIEIDGLWGCGDFPIHRLVSHAEHLGLFGIGIWSSASLIACGIVEPLPGDWAMFHFWNADVRHGGVYEVLMQETAKAMLAQGRTRLNFQEDLGLSGLRHNKLSYRPVGFLKKYTVRWRQERKP